MATDLLLPLPRIRNFKPQIGYGVAMVRRETPHDDRHDPEFPNRIRDGLIKDATVLPQSQIQEIANTAADKAIVKMWLQFGVDLNDADSVRAINEDFIELRRQRKGRERSGMMLKGSVIGGIMTAVLGIAGFVGSYLMRLVSADIHPHP